MIGLEIHCQLTKLESKLFCSCKADYREFEPNTNICPVCMGLPGTLPRLNKKAVEKATMIAMALNCKTPQRIGFFRKNYFYPDLPKNFQITQLNLYGPTSIGEKGRITIEEKDIRIRRIQIEEDPGRLIYEGASERTQITLVDYNRAGTPLVEIVTEPDFENPRQVRIFLNVLSDLLENLGVSDPTLEGAMRADANVSVQGGARVEVKNIGSFYDLEKAIEFELIRQESLKERGIEIMQETRHWDDKRRVTISSRSKEEDEDYRYILEEDIPWVIMDSISLQKWKEGMPESISSKK
jgi:aspartyl-tRNA(Asn)/glutamyl-tRNA(Gln) amidotransferase subunit B